MAAPELSAAAAPAAPPRPMVGAALALAAGIAAGMAFPWPWQVWIWLAIVPAAAGGWMLHRSRRIRGPAPPSGGLLLVAMAGIGAISGAHLERSDSLRLAALPETAFSGSVRIAGRVAEEPRLGPDTVELTLENVRIGPLPGAVAELPFDGRIAVTIRGEQARSWLGADSASLPLPGQAIEARGRLRRADEAGTTPAPFQGWRYWRGREIFALMSINEAVDIVAGTRPTGVSARFLEHFRAARAWMTRNMARHLGPRDLALAQALLLGEAGMIEPGERDAFSHTGLAHVLSVSGLHTGYILLLLIALARICGLPPRLGAWLAIAGLAYYCALTGFKPPVMRAATMGWFLLFGFALKRYANSLASLATAAFFTLLLAPRNLIRLDWQLSYACALSIMLLAAPFMELFSGEPADPGGPGQSDAGRGGLRRWIKLAVADPLGVIVAVQLGLAPLQLLYFMRMSFIGLFANLVAVPWSFVAMCSALLAALFGGVPWLGYAAGALAQIGVGGLSRAVAFFDRFSAWGLALQSMPLWFLALYYLILLGGAGLLSGRDAERRHDLRQRVSLIVASLACVALLAAAPLFPGGRGRLDIYTLDVGQGDCIVLRAPNGRILLIDAGPDDSLDRARRTIAPFLLTLGAGRIGCMILTHADADHIGGARYLIENWPVDLVVEGSDSADTRVWRNLQAAEAQAGVREIEAKPGGEIRGFGAVKLRLLGPVPGRDDNDASVVLSADYRDVQFLATGDLGESAERTLLHAGALRDVDILKVGHHGSRTSSSAEFLEAVQPEVALISAGRRNRYGHPSPDTLARLGRAGAAVFRTDQLGTIWTRTDGRWIETFAFAGGD